MRVWFFFDKFVFVWALLHGGLFFGGTVFATRSICVVSFPALSHWWLRHSWVVLPPSLQPNQPPQCLTSVPRCSDQVFTFFFLSVLVLPHHELLLFDRISLLSALSLCPDVQIWVLLLMFVFVYLVFARFSLMMGLCISTTSPLL